jgi:hypothetical protein
MWLSMKRRVRPRARKGPKVLLVSIPAEKAGD